MLSNELIELCRFFCFADDYAQTVDPRHQGYVLALLAYRKYHPSHLSATYPFLKRLEACGLDIRVRSLSLRRRNFLTFITSAAMGAWIGSEDRGRELLAGALALSQATWAPSEWEPWMGPRPASIPRRPTIALMPDDEPDAPYDDPSGDPEELEAETVFVLPTPRYDDLPEFTPIAQILEGINAWEAICQERLGVELGSMSRAGVPALEGMLRRSDGHWYREPAAPIVQALVYRAAA